MSEQKNPPILTALFALFPVVFLLCLDISAMLEGYTAGRALSHFAFAVLIAQLLCQIVFWKGEICNGQRSRLRWVCNGFLVFWGLWFVLSLFSNYHFVLTDILCVCGLLMNLTAWIQPQEEKSRNSLLRMGLIGGVFGIILYGLMLGLLPSAMWLQFSPFSQALSGIILAYIALVLSKNRLQNFIGLLPLFAVAALLLNALAALLLVYLHTRDTVVSLNAHDSWLLGSYFLLHLLLLGVWVYPIWTKKLLNYTALLLVLGVSVCLPLALMW